MAKAASIAVAAEQPNAHIEIEEADESDEGDDRSGPFHGLFIDFPREQCSDVDQVFAFDEYFESVAKKYDGLYDGNEIPV